jgi:hypothetical protein
MMYFELFVFVDFICMLMICKSIIFEWAGANELKLNPKKESNHTDLPFLDVKQLLNSCILVLKPLKLCPKFCDQ